MYTDLPKNIKFNYDDESNVLTLPGTLNDINRYSKNFQLYMNLQPLYSDQKFDPEEERGGMKLIYGKSESRGESGNRILVTQQADNGIVVDIQ
jgi:hypothetical protein